MTFHDQIGDELTICFGDRRSLNKYLLSQRDKDLGKWVCVCGGCHYQSVVKCLVFSLESREESKKKKDMTHSFLIGGAQSNEPSICHVYANGHISQPINFKIALKSPKSWATTYRISGKFYDWLV